MFYSILDRHKSSFHPSLKKIFKWLRIPTGRLAISTFMSVIVKTAIILMKTDLVCWPSQFSKRPLKNIPFQIMFSACNDHTKSWVCRMEPKPSVTYEACCNFSKFHKNIRGETGISALLFHTSRTSQSEEISWNVLCQFHTKFNLNINMYTPYEHGYLYEFSF